MRVSAEGWNFLRHGIDMGIGTEVVPNLGLSRSIVSIRLSARVFRDLPDVERALAGTARGTAILSRLALLE